MYQLHHRIALLYALTLPEYLRYDLEPLDAMHSRRRRLRSSNSLLVHSYRATTQQLCSLVHSNASSQG